MITHGRLQTRPVATSAHNPRTHKCDEAQTCRPRAPTPRACTVHDWAQCRFVSSRPAAARGCHPCREMTSNLEQTRGSSETGVNTQASNGRLSLARSRCSMSCASCAEQLCENIGSKFSLCFGVSEHLRELLLHLALRDLLCAVLLLCKPTLTPRSKLLCSVILRSSPALFCSVLCFCLSKAFATRPPPPPPPMSHSRVAGGKHNHWVIPTLRAHRPKKLYSWLEIWGQLCRRGWVGPGQDATCALASLAIVSAAAAAAAAMEASCKPASVVPPELASRCSHADTRRAGQSVGMERVV